MVPQQRRNSMNYTQRNHLLDSNYFGCRCNSGSRGFMIEQNTFYIFEELIHYVTV